MVLQQIFTANKIGYTLLISALFLGQATANAEEKETLRLGINDGLAEPLSSFERQEKYKSFSEYISQALKKPVRFEVFQNLKQEGDPKKARFDIAFVKPSNAAALALRDKGSYLVASAKGDFFATFIVAKNSSIKTAADIKGKRIAMPAQISLMSHIGLATLRDLDIDPATQQINHTSYQEQAVYMVEQKLADVAVVGPTVAKKFEAKGGAAVFKSKIVPAWTVVAAPTMSNEDVEKLRTALLNMGNSDSGKSILAQIGVKEFTPGKKEDYLELLKWLRV